MRLWLLTLLLFSSIALAEHSSPGREERPPSVEPAPKSCLATLNNTQKEILSVVRKELKQKRSANEIAADLYNRAADPSLSPTQRNQVVSLAVAAGAAESQRKQMSELVDSGGLKDLLSGGARLKNGELDFDGFDFDHPLTTAEKKELAEAFPAVAAAIPALDDPKRDFPVVLGSWVVLPKAKLEPHGRFRALRLEDYRAELEDKRQELARDMIEYVRADNVANSGVSRFFNRSRSHDRDALEASNRVSRLISELVDDDGIPPATGAKLREGFRLALKESDGNIARGMKQVYLSIGITATLMAVAAPATIALSPYAAGLATFFTTTAPGVAALTSGGLGLTATVGEMGIPSAISVYRGDGSLLCNLGKNAFEKGPSGIASTLVSVGVGLGTGVVAVHAVRAARAIGVSEGALNGFATTVSAISPIPSVLTARNHHRVAEAYRRMARSAKASQDDTLARQYFTEADQSDGQAALTLGFAAASPYVSNVITRKLLDPTVETAVSPEDKSPSVSPVNGEAHLEKVYQNFRVPSLPTIPPVPVRPVLPQVRIAGAGRLGAAVANAENARLRWRGASRRQLGRRDSSKSDRASDDDSSFSD